MALRPELKQEMRMALRHPIKWARGADEPAERIHPREMLTHIIPDIFLGFRNGFHWQDGWLFQKKKWAFKRSKKHPGSVEPGLFTVSSRIFIQIPIASRGIILYNRCNAQRRFPNWTNAKTIRSK